MSKTRVLMADDEARFQTVSQMKTNEKDFEMIWAGDGREVIEKLVENPDVLILDVAMSGVDGQKTLKKIKKRMPDLPVIILTGYGSVLSAEKALAAGVFDCLDKPYEPNLFSAKIESAKQFREKRKPGKKGFLA